MSRGAVRFVGSVSVGAIVAHEKRVAVATSRQGSLPKASAGQKNRVVDNLAVSYHPGGTKSSVTIAPAPRPIAATPAPGQVGFVGLTGPSQAAVNGGGDLEPPDQGLCAGQGLVLEFINSAFTVYDLNGFQKEAVIPAYALFQQPASAVLSDPRCYYDAQSGRWFLTMFQISFDSSGNLVAPATQYVAVSASADPLGAYNVFAFDTTDKGTKNCPCIGDFDQLGADNNGIYISTNEFGDAGGYNGAVIYALSKQGIVTATGGSPIPVFAYHIPKDPFGQPYHITPATSPLPGQFAPGTEYFVESNSDAASGNSLVVYAMLHTAALATPAPPALVAATLASETYAFPPNATQMKGPIPLGQANHNAEGTIQADFNAIQEVTYTAGKLFAEASTKIGAGTDGAAWFVITPKVAGKTFTATMSSQGYLSTAGQNLIYPVIAVNAAGHGYMAFTLSGPNYFPSAAYVAFGPTGPTGSINIAQAGAGPEDSFTCYAAFVGPNFGGCRWGDYSMGVAMGSRIVMATEMVPNTARDYETNWGTYVWSAPAP